MINPKDFRIIICGTARNVEKTILDDYQIITSAFGFAKQLNWLVIESDSTDSTISKLNEIKKFNNNFNFISLGLLQTKITSRIERIAFCRNKYLAELNYNKNIDYVVVADLDGINSRITKNSVLTCWKRDDWDVCTANQIGPYYDIYALRHPLWQNNDCLQEFNFLSNFSNNIKQLKFSAIYSKMITIPEDNDWIEVDSAFGGLAIYKRSILGNLTYEPKDAEGIETCEHVTLHRKIKSHGGRIFINPSLVNSGINEHSRHRLKYNGYLRIK